MKRAGKCANKKSYAYMSHALQMARKQYLEYGVKSSVYECPTCLDFHLTTKPQGKHNTEKYFTKWNKQWMKERYNEFLSLEKKMCDMLTPPTELSKKRAKRQRYKANKAIRIANGESPNAKPEKQKVTLRRQNTLPLAEQKAFFATFDNKVYTQPKSFWSRILGIIG